MKKRSPVGTALLVILLLIGWGILLYPTLSDLWNTYRNSRIITHYKKAVSDTPDDKMVQMFEAARQYNLEHKANTVFDAFNTEQEALRHPYDELLNPAGDGIMGYLDVPGINLQVPIFHGVGAKGLERGCGHLQGTSLPVGGASSHAVMAAHRGLPSAKLFTDLDQVKVGDTFYIHVLHETLAYQVDCIKTVLPEESGALEIEQGKDIVTLLTCTPYGVNSHRLLVMGSRVSYQPEKAQKEAPSIQRDPRIYLLISGSAAALLIMIGLLYSGKRKKKKLAEKQRYEREDGENA
ncbi:MAG: class C sortase [Lachnospiraceae bacterium]|nr:class C sortase [Lachnospiraceae bacterium]MDY5742100.1 class C sortase [Lachnospiraceae bacterium]